VARPAKFDNDEVLDKAMMLFWRQGPTTTSIRDLEKAVDLRAPSIYRRFTSKDALFRLSLERYLDLVIDTRIERYLGHSDNPIADLERFFVTAVEPHEHDETSLGCLLTATATAAPSLPDDLRPVVAEGIERIRSAFELELQRADELGLLPSGADSHRLSHQLLLDFQGLLVLARSGEASASLTSRIQAVFGSFSQAQSEQEVAPCKPVSG
jgi:TetR/AcrR family transcriptional regulator, transcriptional repressor for nem operon